MDNHEMTLEDAQAKIKTLEQQIVALELRVVTLASTLVDYQKLESTPMLMRTRTSMGTEYSDRRQKRDTIEDCGAAW